VNALRIAAAVVLAALVQVVGVALLPRFSLLVDPFLLVVVWAALRSTTAGGQLAGLAAGLVHDGLAGGLYGLHGVADTVVGYLVALAGQRVVVQQQAVRVLLYALAAAGQQLLLVALLLLLVPGPEVPAWGWMLGKVAVTAVLGAFLVGMEASLRRRYGSWQLRRSRRLRFR
jgi:rod shape-determining protein MreD